MALYDPAPDGIFMVMSQDKQAVSPMMPFEHAKVAASIMADKTGEPVMIVQLYAVAAPSPPSPYPSYVAN